MELKFLGRGSAFNVKEGNTSAYIKQDDMLLLIDCGESIFQKILEKKLLDDVKEVNVLITHLHSDHCGSLSSLIMYCFYCKGIKPNVYFPQRNKIHELLNLTGASEGVLWEDLSIEYMEEHHRLSIVPTRVSHVKEFRNYGYHIENIDNGSTILYSGDTNGVDDDFIKYDFLNWEDNIKVYHDTCLADYEGNVHTSLKKLCELVPKGYRSLFYCMHLDCDELIEKAISEGFNVVEAE
jgi:ribonuclease BN (tRNA processing enzyme)